MGVVDYWVSLFDNVRWKEIEVNLFLMFYNGWVFLDVGWLKELISSVL